MILVSSEPPEIHSVVFQRLRELTDGLVKDRLKMFQKVLSSDHPGSLQRLDQEVFSEDGGQGTISRDAILKISLDFLRTMKQDELAECLQSSKNI